MSAWIPCLVALAVLASLALPLTAVRTVLFSTPPTWASLGEEQACLFGDGDAQAGLEVRRVAISCDPSEPDSCISSAANVSVTISDDQYGAVLTDIMFTLDLTGMVVAQADNFMAILLRLTSDVNRVWFRFTNPSDSATNEVELGTFFDRLESAFEPSTPDGAFKTGIFSVWIL